MACFRLAWKHQPFTVQAAFLPFEDQVCMVAAIFSRSRGSYEGHGRQLFFLLCSCVSYVLSCLMFLSAPPYINKMTGKWYLNGYFPQISCSCQEIHKAGYAEACSYGCCKSISFRGTVADAVYMSMFSGHVLR